MLQSLSFIHVLSGYYIYFFIIHTFLTKECYWERKEVWDVAKNVEFVFTWKFCLHLHFFLYRYCRWNINFRCCGIHYWYSEFAAYPTTRPPHFSPPGLLVWVLKGSSDLGDVLYLVGSFWVLKDAGWMCRSSCLYTHTCIHWMWSCCDPSNKPSLVMDY